MPQLIKLLGMIGIALLVVKATRLIGLHTMSSWIAGAVFLLHPSMILGGEPDTWGDVLCTALLLLFFCLTLWVQQTKITRAAALLAAGGMTTIILLSKEAGVICFGIPLCVMVFCWTSLSREHRVTLGIMATVSLLLIAGFLVYRSHLGLALTSAGVGTHYQLRFGVNVLYSIFLEVLFLLSPVSTVKVAMAGTMWRGLAAAWMLLAGGMLAQLMWRFKTSLQWRKLVLLAALFFAVQGPSLLMYHTNEQNFSRSLPFGLMAVVMVFERCWPQLSSGFRRASMAVFVLWLVFGIHATIGKVECVATLHSEAQAFRKRVKELMPIPPKRIIHFVAEYPSSWGYACFVGPLCAVLYADANEGMQFEYNDRSFRARATYVTSFDSLAFLSPPPDITIDKAGAVRLYRPPPAVIECH